MKTRIRLGWSGEWSKHRWVFWLAFAAVLSGCGQGAEPAAEPAAAGSGGQGTSHPDESSQGGPSTEGGGCSSGGSAGGDAGTGGGDAGAPGEISGRKLVWSDEFNGGALDAAKWEHEVDCWGGGNNEDQCYVSDPKNSYVKDGVLRIVALADNPSGPTSDGAGTLSRGHSSARLRTKGRGDWTYGRFEARIRLPFGQGLWPAFWMLPTDWTYGGWALSGEIDIVEAVNLGPGQGAVHGTLHYGGAWPSNTHSGAAFTPEKPPWEAFHVYAVEWEPGEIRWYVDDEHYATQTAWHAEGFDYPAPFDQRFHLILNVAVGGNWPGPPDGTTSFPQVMEVDYVRVYQ